SQVVSAAKLPILNHNEFDLWKMRIEQYFLMTDYSLWEVIFNGDSSVPTRVIEGVIQPVAPTTAEHRLARKNELKARGTLLMALPDKHQLKINIHKDPKTLMEAIEKRFGRNKETKKVQKTLLKQHYENFTGSSSENLDQIHDRLQKLISQLEILGESLSQEDINLKFLRSLPTEWRTHTLIWRNKTDLEEQSLDDLFNILKIYEDEVKSSFVSTFTQNIAFVSSSNTDSTNESVSAATSVSTVSAKIHVSALPNVDTLSNVVIYLFFSSQSTSPQLDNDDLKQINDDDLEEMDLKWPMAMLTVKARRFLQRTRRNLGANGPTSMGFDMSKVECYNCHMKGHFTRKCSDESLPPSPIYDRYQTGDGYHVVPPPYTGTFMPHKPDLVFNDPPNVNETIHTAFNVKLSPTKPDNDLSHTHRASAPIIEDWVSDSEADFEDEITQNAPSFVQPNEQVKPPRPFVKTLETSILAATHTTTIPNPKINGNRKNRKRCFVLLTQSKLVHITAARPVTADVPNFHVTKPRLAKHDKGVIDSGCSRHVTWNMSYLSDFEELNGGYVAFGGNPKGGKISGKGNIDRKVDEGFLVGYSVSSKAFRVFNKKAREDNVQHYVLFPVWSSGFNNPQDTDGDDAFKEKEPVFEVRKSQSEVYVSSSSSAQRKKHDDKNKRDAKDKIPDDTNTFSAVGPSNTVVSPTQEKSSNVVTSQLPDDLNMLELEDITYSDDEEDVGAEADFTNLETTIIVSPIPTTRVHKDHPVTQIIEEEPKRVDQALKDPSWIEAIQEELLQFKLQKVWVLVDLPDGKRAIDLRKTFEKLMKDKFRMSLIGELTFFLGLQVKQEPDGIFISQDKYVAEILRKFRLTDGKSANTPIDTKKPLLKDPDGEDVDVHTYRSMTGSLMYLTSSRPDIMFAVCACARFQVTPKASYLHAVKRIFRYLKGKPHLGLWYLKDSPFNLVAYSDSDYTGASLDRKFTTWGCQFLRCRLISWQCKKQTVVATSSTKAEYVAAASCGAQVLWIQNQLLDYGYNFINTIIYIDNSSTICIIKNPVLHSKTKHIEIRHHFIRDCNEKKLIQVIKIPSDDNFADLLTKAFDVGRFQYFVASIRLLNP
nr:putative ribonuclease H-like domain-containing protein [Tanacetum cinerariifolium]